MSTWYVCLEHNDKDIKYYDNTKKQSVISQSKVVSIAKNAVKGNVIKVEKEEGIKYEIEMETKKGEADVMVDGTTGKILKIDYDEEGFGDTLKVPITNHFIV
ncbi:PepSY domain-containing protein [Gottfriedia sp. NPDC057991]|uniref:PepSY domain-containing protein n=1 Tax=Gottfriedia sp. NPDC057991 TaxID=3346298 RepID=UPI0036DB9F4B